MFLSEFHNFEDPTTQIPYLVLKPTSGKLPKNPKMYSGMH